MMHLALIYAYNWITKMIMLLPIELELVSQMLAVFEHLDMLTTEIKQNLRLVELGLQLKPHKLEG